MVWPTLGSRTAKEQNRTCLIRGLWMFNTLFVIARGTGANQRTRRNVAVRAVLFVVVITYLLIHLLVYLLGLVC